MSDDIELNFTTPSYDLEFCQEKVFEIEFPTTLPLPLPDPCTMTLERQEKVFEIEFPTTELTMTFCGVTDLYMNKSVYDPTNVNGNAFLLDNHTGTLMSEDVLIDGGLLG